MPMIDVYAAAGRFADTHRLAVDLATAAMTIEQVPDIPMFRQNTAAFVHELPAGCLSNVDGDSGYVRIQVLTNAGALDRSYHPAGFAASAGRARQTNAVRQLPELPRLPIEDGGAQHRRGRLANARGIHARSHALLARRPPRLQRPAGR